MENNFKPSGVVLWCSFNLFGYLVQIHPFPTGSFFFVYFWNPIIISQHDMIQFMFSESIIKWSFINKTKQLIPLLTNEDLLENETKQKINEITGKINLLTENFQKIEYPFENEKDLVEIPDNVKKGLEIVPVTTVDQVIEHALAGPLVPLSEDEIEGIASLNQDGSDSNFKDQIHH